jgi:hypothetical protein
LVLPDGFGLGSVLGSTFVSELATDEDWGAASKKEVLREAVTG